MKKRDFFNWVNIRKWIFWILYIVWRKQKGQLPIIRRSFEHTHAIGRGGMGFTGVGFYLVVAKQSFFLSYLPMLYKRSYVVANIHSEGGV